MATDPTTIQPDVYWDSEVVYMPHWQRFNGTTLEPLLNSASGIFPKPVVQAVCIPICHIIQWKTLSDAERKDQANATNNTTWHSWEPGQAWVSRIIDESEEVNESNTQRVHYVVKCCEFGWDNTFPQMGYFHGTAPGSSLTY